MDGKSTELRSFSPSWEQDKDRPPYFSSVPDGLCFVLETQFEGLVQISQYREQVHGTETSVRRGVFSPESRRWIRSSQVISTWAQCLSGDVMFRAHAYFSVSRTLIIERRTRSANRRSNEDPGFAHTLTGTSQQHHLNSSPKPTQG